MDVREVQRRMDLELLQIRPLRDLALKSGVAPSHALLGLCAALLVLVYFDIGAQLIVNLVGFVYPAFESFKALETFRRSDDQQWLTYWVVFGFFNILEYFRDMITFYIPFYYVIKLAFLLWLYLPFTMGADKIYVTLLRPLLLDVVMHRGNISRVSKKSSSSD